MRAIYSKKKVFNERDKIETYQSIDSSEGPLHLMGSIAVVIEAI